jgi:LysM repeat protein
MSACVVLAWCLLALVAAAGNRGRDHPVAQANISIASSTQAVLTSESVTAANARAAAGPAQQAARWTVRPGDTLSAIADALGVPGGWQALYAANRQAVGPDPDLIRAGTVLALPGAGSTVRYTVAPGDTLSAIAAALKVPGGWQALYAANRQAVGPDPDAIQAGTVLAAPRPAAQAGALPAAHRKAPRPAAAGPGRPRHQAPAGQAAHPGPAASRPRPVRQATAPAGRQPAGHPAAPGPVTAPGHVTAAAGGMPRWLEDVLLAAGVLAATAFAAEPAAALARRRRRRPAGPAPFPVPASPRDDVRRAAEKARIILADHERLIVTYCARDHAVYVFTPPGEDPQAVLRAARLVLPEETYEDLAGHLGVPSAWPLE